MKPTWQPFDTHTSEEGVVTSTWRHPDGRTEQWRGEEFVYGPNPPKPKGYEIPAGMTGVFLVPGDKTPEGVSTKVLARGAAYTEQEKAMAAKINPSRDVNTEPTLMQVREAIANEPMAPTTSVLGGGAINLNAGEASQDLPPDAVIPSEEPHDGNPETGDPDSVPDVAGVLADAAKVEKTAAKVGSTKSKPESAA